MIIKKKHIVAGFMSAMWLVSIGCAEGDIGGPPTSPGQACTMDNECQSGERCNIVEGLCKADPSVRMDMGGRDLGRMDMTVVPVMPDMDNLPDIRVIVVPDLASRDQGAGADTGTEPVDMSVPDMPPQDMGPPPDMFVDPCLGVSCASRDNVCQGDFLVSYGGGVCSDGTCLYGEMRTDCTAMNNRRCENGACVDRVCNPGCEAPGTCNQGSCAYPTCSNVGDACDPNATEQGDFLCLIDDPDTGGAHCFDTCPASGSGNGCAVGQRCFAAVTGEPDLLICLDSECSADTDCGNGTCIKFENSFGYCEPGGSGAPGALCDPGANQWCQQGSTCVVPGGASQGTCETVCEPWTGAGCGASEYCSIYTNRIGTCTSEQDTLGTGLFQECATPGDYCDDATPCFNNGPSNICFKFCRPNSADCANIAASVTCDNYIFPGDRTLGICNAAACTLDTDCPASSDCVSGICRARCTSASVATDCGSGSWTCVGGYCE